MDVLWTRFFPIAGLVPLAEEEATAMNEQEFRSLYDATARPILAYLVGVTGRKDVADDLLQETYCRFLVRQPPSMNVDETRRMDVQIDVRAAMCALKPRERELLWLAYVEGMGHAEIAAATGLRTISVRMLLFRARRRAAGLLLSKRETV